MYFKFGPDYPQTPPEARFYQAPMHCNINSYGRICHSVLSRNYTAETSMTTILQCIHDLFVSPSPEDPLDSDLAMQFHNGTAQYEASIMEHVQVNAKYTRTEWRENLLNGSILKE